MEYEASAQNCRRGGDVLTEEGTGSLRHLGWKDSGLTRILVKEQLLGCQKSHNEFFLRFSLQKCIMICLTTQYFIAIIIIAAVTKEKTVESDSSFPSHHLPLQGAKLGLPLETGLNQQTAELSRESRWALEVGGGQAGERALWPIRGGPVLTSGRVCGAGSSAGW